MDITKGDDAVQHEPEKMAKSLASDLIFDILTRVPFISLFSCRCVSKSWQSITHEPYFIRQHCKRTKTFSGFFIQSMVRNRYKSTFISLYNSPEIPQPSISFLPENARIMASSPLGLLCCVSQEQLRIPRYYVCKPTTKEWLQIANPMTRYFTERIEMVVQSMEPLCYKLVRFSWPRHSKSYLFCEIFNSNLSAWSRSEDISLPGLMLLLPGSGVLIKGNIHWMTDEDYIFAFHVDNENWKMISLPHEGPELNIQNRVHITKCGEQLSLIYYNHVWMEVWMLEDYSRQRWERKRRVIWEACYGENCSLLGFSATETVLLQWIYNFIWYNYMKEEYSSIKVDHLAAQSVYFFESDMIPLNMSR